jgi:hypothetical protein
MRNLTYIVNDEGERLFVQLPVDDWNRLMSERKRLVAERHLRNRLKSSLRESERISSGEKRGVSLKEFLNEM